MLERKYLSEIAINMFGNRLYLMQQPISMQHKINYTEAALIRYFQPKYNDKFKHQFPNNQHTSYKECFDKELNMVCVEIQTEEICVELWSQSVEYNSIHLTQYNMFSLEDRRAMFDFAFNIDK
jgi:hypothetical protein